MVHLQMIPTVIISSGVKFKKTICYPSINWEKVEHEEVLSEALGLFQEFYLFVDEKTEDRGQRSYLKRLILIRNKSTEEVKWKKKRS